MRRPAKSAAAAAAEIETAQQGVIRRFTGCKPRQCRFFQHVFAQDAPIDDAVKDQAGDVVVAHAQDVDGQVFRIGEQALAAEVDFDAALFEQALRFAAQATGFLHRDAQARGVGVGSHGFSFGIFKNKNAKNLSGSTELPKGFLRMKTDFAARSGSPIFRIQPSTRKTNRGGDGGGQRQSDTWRFRLCDGLKCFLR